MLDESTTNQAVSTTPINLAETAGLKDYQAYLVEVSGGAVQLAQSATTPATATLTGHLVSVGSRLAVRVRPGFPPWVWTLSGTATLVITPQVESAAGRD